MVMTYHNVTFILFISKAALKYRCFPLFLKVFMSIKPAMQSQKAVSTYFTSKQILPSGFGEQNKTCHVSGTCDPYTIQAIWYI